MAIAYVNAVGDYEATDVSVINSGPLNVTDRNTIVVALHYYGTSSNFSSISDTAGNTYVKAGSTYIYSSTLRSEFWYVLNAKGSSVNNVTVTFSVLSEEVHLIQAQYSGMPLVGALNTAYAPAGTTDSSSPYATIAASTATANELIIGCFRDVENTNPFSSSSPSVFRYRINSFCIADRQTTAPGSYGVAVAGTFTTPVMCYAKSFKEAAPITKSKLLWIPEI